MGSCIICGTDVGGGRVCDSHQEDVVFDFRGDSPHDLIPNRFYRGVVDGYAEFGVFVDLAPGVTGLLHRSELDRRLDSLEWEPGDDVFVQVTGVRDNGNVDLAWSIRQADREFRGALVQAASGDRLPDGAADDEAADGTDADGDPSEDAEAAGDGPTDDEPVEDEADEAAPDGTAAADDPERVAVATLGDAVGSTVRIEGEVVGVHQTGGPTVFEVSDASGAVDVAAFVEPGVRAHPDVEVGDAVRVDGAVENHRGDVQVESEALALLAAQPAQHRKLHGPEGQADDGDPDQLALDKEVGHGNAPMQGEKEQKDVRPAAVVGEHQPPLVARQALGQAHLQRRLQPAPHPPQIAAHPVERHAVERGQYPATQAPPRRDDLDQGQQDQWHPPGEGGERQQQNAD